MKLRALLLVASVAAFGATGTGVAGASSASTEYFTAVQTSPTGSVTVVAAGPIAATGTLENVGGHRAGFVFPDGTLTIRLEVLTESQRFDSRTCTETSSETGTYVIQRGSGAYSQVTGSGSFKVSAIATGCDPSAPPTSFVQMIMAHGPLTL